MYICIYVYICKCVCEYVSICMCVVCINLYIYKFLCHTCVADMRSMVAVYFI